MQSEHVPSMARGVLRKGVILFNAAVWLLFSPQLVPGADVTVECSNPKAKVRTITAAPAPLNKTAENTVRVSGACSEWLLITGFENLTLLAEAGASISAPTTAPPEGYDPIVLFVTDAGNVSVKGFTINGRGIVDEPVVACARVRFCMLEKNTIQGGDIGFLGASNANPYLVENTIQDNTNAGVYITREVSASVYGGTIQRSGNGIITSGSTLTFYRGLSSGLPVVIQDNPGSGVVASLNSTVTVNSGAGAIRSYGGSGIDLTQGSVATIRGSNEITGGASGAVVIGDLSLADFQPGSTISGGPPAVNCLGRFAVASGAGLAEHQTNCK